MRDCMASCYKQYRCTAPLTIYVHVKLLMYDLTLHIENYLINLQITYNWRSQLHILKKL